MQARTTFRWPLMVFATVFALSSVTARAEHPAPDPDKVQAKMQEAAERLKLTEPQRAQLKPVVEEHVEQLRALKAKYPPEGSRESKRAMFGEMRALRQDYDTKVRAILTPEQQKEWEQMRKESREQMREQMRERRAGQT